MLRRQSFHDHYCLGDSVIGRGGIARVLKCKHVQTGLERAVKKIPNKTNKQVVGVEGLIQMTLDHPHVARLFESFEDVTNTYLVMEVCAGGTVLDRMVYWHRFSEIDAAIMVQQILCALRYIHKAEVLHGDVIPQNVLLVNCMEPVDNLAKLCDFGCARRSLTTCEDLVGLSSVMQFLLAGIKSACMPPNAKTRIVSNAAGAPVQVSHEAGSFLDHLLEAKSRRPNSAGAFLCHAWIEKNVPDKSDKRSSSLLSSFVTKLRLFSSYCRFKKLACIAAARGLGWEIEQQAVKLFLSLDTKWDGFVTPYKLKKALQKAKVYVPSDLTKLLKEADVDGVGVLDYSTFLAIMLDSETYKQKVACRLAFSIFDYDGDGCAIHEEISAALWGLDADGRPIEGPVAQLVQGIDKNEDGVISFEEFSHMLCTPNAVTSKTRQAERRAAAAMIPKSERHFIVKSKWVSLVTTNSKNRKLNKVIKARKQLMKLCMQSDAATAATASDIANLEDLVDFLCDLNDGEMEMPRDSDDEDDASSDEDPDVDFAHAPEFEDLLDTPSAQSTFKDLGPEELALPQDVTFTEMPFMPTSGSPGMKKCISQVSPTCIVHI